MLLHEHLGRSVLIGHSMGAATAVAVAAQAPDLVAALVLEDPPWWMSALDDEHRDPLKIARGEPIVQWIEGMQKQTLDEVVDYAHSDHPGWDEVEYEDWARSKQRMNLESVDLPFRDIPDSVRMQWASIHCPALLLTGDVDRGAIVTDELAQQFLAGVAGGERSHHPSASHDVRRDAPADVSAAITDFLRRRVGFTTDGTGPGSQ
ncbi:MAG: alpha/beta hydrolase [Actinobacteria bacterium]|nr:alpha/beta hydrolase [Actinomycetota bacterium]